MRKQSAIRAVLELLGSITGAAAHSWMALCFMLWFVIIVVVVVPVALLATSIQHLAELVRESPGSLGVIAICAYLLRGVGYALAVVLFISLIDSMMLEFVKQTRNMRKKAGG